MTAYDVLQPSQKRLLSQFAPVTRAGYALYGGTAIALKLGHRESVDFDFFTDRLLDERSLVRAMPALRDAVPLQREPDTWSVLVGPDGEHERPVKLSFFGGLSFGRVGTPALTSGGELLLASSLDLLGHKLKVLLQRVEVKDYQDIAALLRSGLTVEAGLGAAQALFGSSFPPTDALRAMTYFDEGDFGGLTTRDRQTLIDAAKQAGGIVSATIVSRVLAPAMSNDADDGRKHAG